VLVSKARQRLGHQFLVVPTQLHAPQPEFSLQDEEMQK
jgi:hypothetical protein